MKTGRNEKCPCGSGLKYKFCCLKSRVPNELSDEALLNNRANLDYLYGIDGMPDKASSHICDEDCDNCLKGDC